MKQSSKLVIIEKLCTMELNNDGPKQAMAIKRQVQSSTYQAKMARNPLKLPKRVQRKKITIVIDLKIQF
jgi:hypothetical protein